MSSIKHFQTKELIEKLLNLNSSIDLNIFKKTKFIDQELEDNFLIDENNLDETFKIKSDLIITLGWLCIFIYNYLVFYRSLCIYSCSVMFLISLFLSTLRYYDKETKAKSIIDHIQVFNLIIYLNLKALYVIFYLSSEKYDYDYEIIRTITYNWVATTVLIIQKLDGRPSIIILLNSINFTTIIIIHVYSIKYQFYYLDAICSMIVAIGGFFFKKFSDIKIRSYYGEKIKSDRMCNFFLGFIDGLNACYLNLKNNETISYGSNMKQEIDTLGLFEDNNLNAKTIDECKDNDKFIFLNSSSKSSLPLIFLNSLKEYKSNKSSREDNEIILDNTQDILLTKINKMQSEDIESSLYFKNIGIYFIKSSVGIRYYDVYFRKVKLTDTNVFYDLVFYRATELIVSLLRIEEESKHKKQIFGKLIHEFKTPLNSIIGLIDNIKETNQDNGGVIVKHNLKTIKNLSNYVIYLINDIINYSSTRNYDELNIIMHETDIRKSILFSFDILNSLLSCYNIKSKSIITELEFEDDIHSLTVYADESRLKQILLNLVSNAVKFTKSGFIKIKCIKDADKKHILISVADSGSGIKEENHKYIFNEFFMESVGYRHNSHGTGIGLSICKNLAKRMNIEIKFNSILGKGTEFTIEIPVYNDSYDNNNSFNLITKKNNILEDLSQINSSDYNESSDVSLNNKLKLSNISSQKSFTDNIYSNKCLEETIEANNIKINPLKSNFLSLHIPKPTYKTINTNNYKIVNNIQSQINSINTNDITLNINNPVNMRILIVDDDKYICNSIKILINRIFKEAKCNIDVIIGYDGIDIIQNVIEDQKNGNKIKCIITDENMEYINGSEAIKIVRSLENEYKVKNVKIITATSQDDMQLVNKIRNIGADIVMSKPLSKSTLTKTFQDLKILNI